MAEWNPINVYNKHHIDDHVESTNEEGDDINGSKFSGAADNGKDKDREQISHSIDQQPSLSEPQREPVQIFPSDFGGYMLHPEHSLTQDSTLKQGSEDMASRNNDKPSGFDLYRLKTATQQKPPGYQTDPVLTHDKDVSFFGDSNVGGRTSRSTLDQDGLHRGLISTLPFAGSRRRLSHQRGVPISGIDDVLPSTNQSQESKSAPAFDNVLIGDKVLQDNSNVSSKPVAEDDTRSSSLFGMATAAVTTVGAGTAAAASGVSNAFMGGSDKQQQQQQDSTTATKDQMPSTWPSSPSINEASALGISASEGPDAKNATNCTHEPAIHGQYACFYTKDHVCDEVSKDEDHSMCEHVKEPSLHGQNPSFYGDSGKHDDGIIKNQRLPVQNVEQSFGTNQATQTFDESHLHKNDNSFIHTDLPVTNVDQTSSGGLLAEHAVAPDQATQTQGQVASDASHQTQGQVANNASQTQGWSNGAGVDEQAAQIQQSDSHKGLLAAGGAGSGAAFGGLLGKNASSKNDQGITGVPMSEDLSSTSGIQSKFMPISTAPVETSGLGSSSIPAVSREPVNDKHMKKIDGIWSAGNLLSRNNNVSEGVNNAPQANESKFNAKNLLAAGGIGGGIGAAASSLLNRKNKVGDNKDISQSQGVAANSDQSQGLNNNDITATAPQALANSNFVTAPQSDYKDKQVPTSTTDDSQGLTAPQTLAQGNTDSTATDSTAPEAMGQSDTRDTSASQSVYDHSELPQTWGDQVIPFAPQIATDSETYNANLHRGYDGDQGVSGLPSAGSQNVAPQSLASDGYMNNSTTAGSTDNTHPGALAAGAAAAGGAALGAGGILGLGNMMSSRNNKVDTQALGSSDNQGFTDASQDWSKDNDQDMSNTAPQTSLDQGTDAQKTYGGGFGDSQIPTSGSDGIDQGLTTASQTLGQGTDSQGIDSKGLDSRGIDSQDTDAQGLGSQDINSQGIDSRGTYAEGFGSQGIDSQGIDSQDLDSQGIDSQGTDSQGLNTQALGSQGVDSQTQNDSSLSNIGTDSNGMSNQGVLAASGGDADAAGAGVGGILGLGSAAMASHSNNNNKVDPQTLDSTPTTTQGLSSDAAAPLSSDQGIDTTQDLSGNQNITTAARQAFASNNLKSASLDDYGDNNQVPTNDDSRVFDSAPQTLEAKGADVSPAALDQGTDAIAPTSCQDNAWSKDDFVTTGNTVTDDSHHDDELAAAAGAAALGAGGIMGSLSLGNKDNNKESLSESQTWSTATQGTYSPALAEVEDSPMTPVNHNAPKGWLSNSDGQTPQAIDVNNQSLGAFPQDTHSNDYGVASDQGLGTTGQGANDDLGITSAPEGLSNDNQGVQDQGLTTAPQALANNDVTTTTQPDLSNKQAPISGSAVNSQGVATAPDTTQGDSKDNSHTGAIAGGVVGAAAATIGGILGLRHHEQQQDDDTHPLSKTTSNHPNDSESISSTRATTGKIVPSVRNQDEIKDRPIEHHENFKNVTDSIDVDHRHVMKNTRKNSITQGLKTKAAAATGAFTNAVRHLSSHGSGSSTSIKKDQIHVRRISDAELFKNQTLQEGHTFGNNEQKAFGGNTAFGNTGVATATADVDVLPNVIPHDTSTSIPRTFENINGQDVPRSVETTHAQSRLENAAQVDQTVPTDTVESTQSKNLVGAQGDLGRESIPKQDALVPDTVAQHASMEEPNSLGIHSDANAVGLGGEPGVTGDYDVSRRRASSANSEHLKYTGVNQAYARIPGVNSMKPAGTNDVGQDGEVNFIKNEQQDVNKKSTPTRSSFFSGHMETRRGSFQKTVGKLFRNGSMQDKGTLKQISGQEKINAYNATHNKL